jgi:sulfur-carrier protein
MMTTRWMPPEACSHRREEVDRWSIGCFDCPPPHVGGDKKIRTMPEFRRIHVKFFALLREQAGCSELAVNTTAISPAALYAELMKSRGLTVSPGILTFAVNEKYVPSDTPLREADRVAFIPPVAGG